MKKTCLFLAIICATAFAQSQQLQSSDGDGIPDIWKTEGVDLTFADGHKEHLDLASLGVKPGRKAVIVWVDWMAAPDHTHRPIPSNDKQTSPLGAATNSHAIENAPLQRIVRSFDTSPVDNNKGVELAIIWPDKLNWPDRPFTSIPEQSDLGSTFQDSAGLHYDWTEFDKIRDQRFPISPKLFGRGFHYAMFIHRMNGLSNTGLSKTIPGDEFLVSLGDFANQVGTAEDQCGTFMHELGHNLGLNHGGADDIGYKPNYLSVMNYMFQRVGVAVLGEYGHFDYSRFALAEIDENSLNPRIGISGDASGMYGTAHVCAQTPPSCGSGDYSTDSYNLVWRLSCPIDWKCSPTDDGTDPCVSPETLSAQPFRQDVNGDGCIGQLKGFNDWANLHFWTPPQPGGGEAVKKELLPTDELDVHRPTLLPAVKVTQVKVTPVEDGVDVRWSRIPLQRVLGYEVLRQGPSGIPSIVRRTIESEFVDTTASSGVRYTYSVRPIFALSLPEEIETLTRRVSDAVDFKAANLEQRAKKLNLLPNGAQLVRGMSSQSVQVVAGQSH